MESHAVVSEDRKAEFKQTFKFDRHARTDAKKASTRRKRQDRLQESRAAAMKRIVVKKLGATGNNMEDEQAVERECIARRDAFFNAPLTDKAAYEACSFYQEILLQDRPYVTIFLQHPELMDRFIYLATADYPPSLPDEIKHGYLLYSVFAISILLRYKSYPLQADEPPRGHRVPNPKLEDYLIGRGVVQALLSVIMQGAYQDVCDVSNFGLALFMHASSPACNAAMKVDVVGAVKELFSRFVSSNLDEIPNYIPFACLHLTNALSRRVYMEDMMMIPKSGTSTPYLSCDTIDMFFAIGMTAVTQDRPIDIYTGGVECIKSLVVDASNPRIRKMLADSPEAVTALVNVTRTYPLNEHSEKAVCDVMSILAQLLMYSNPDTSGIAKKLLTIGVIQLLDDVVGYKHRDGLLTAQWMSVVDGLMIDEASFYAVAISHGYMDECLRIGEGPGVSGTLAANLAVLISVFGTVAVANRDEASLSKYVCSEGCMDLLGMMAGQPHLLAAVIAVYKFLVTCFRNAGQSRVCARIVQEMMSRELEKSAQTVFERYSRVGDGEVVNKYVSTVLECIYDNGAGANDDETLLSNEDTGPSSYTF
jgi:hypothetical protein